MSVGILTWYDVLNYGSVFQAYALQEEIELLGQEAQILRHDRQLPGYYHNRLAEISPKGIYQWLRNQSPNRRRFRSETKKKYFAFEDFRKEYLNIGSLYSETDADRIVLGSDQIFDINGMYYPFQFGGEMVGKKVSTYAPCFGETTMESLKASEHYDEIVSLIKQLDQVNARDENTRFILSQIRNEEIPMVLDPTLLYSFKKEKKSWNERLINEKYCIVYTWGGITTSGEFAESCKSFAKKNGLKLVSVGEIRPWCDIQYASASPVEFFELFMYADMVLTNMFHGTCFSILMERPFYSFVMPHNKNKLAGLLKYLDLENQIVSDLSKLPMNIPVIDYVLAGSRIELKRETSVSALSQCIS